MWYCPEKYKKNLPDVNQELLKIKGYLNTKESKASLAKFLRYNLGFTTELMSGIKLAPYQEVTLKGMFNRNFSMCVWGRGCGKSFIAAVYCYLQCIFEPNTKIIIAGPTFRTARFIFENLEKIVDSKGAELVRQAFGAKSKRNDQFKWDINGGTITAIPLSGEKIRGFRANVLLLDEFLLLSEDIVKTVLMPFLVAPQDIAERIKIREMEDSLIEKGEMKEKDRIVFGNKSKMIALSSASYTFENLYKTYKEWTNKIYSKEDNPKSSYFISQLGYEALPEEMIDRTIIEEAQNGGQSHSSFQREYCAQFTDGSDSYFSAKKMFACTIPDGQAPSTLIKGESNKKYILAIDPSFSNSPTSDFFAMAVLELNEEDETSTLVHNYAVAGGNLKDHINYLYYLLTYFDFEMICIDNAGYQFIDGANESKEFRNKKINLKFLNFDSNKEDIDYQLEIKKLKNEKNKKDGKICFKQVFTSDFLRRSNESLQSSIDHKKIWFASKTTANETSFQKASSIFIPLKLIKENSILDFIEWQDDLVYQVKKQCALVEVKSTPRGVQTFDLPLHLKRSASISRARKDNYTALLLANWAANIYFDAKKAKLDTINATFEPKIIR